jgi:hypothetical protein
MSLKNPVNILQSYTSNTHLILFLSYMPRSSEWFFASGFPIKIPYACVCPMRTTFPAHLIVLNSSTLHLNSNKNENCTFETLSIIN